MTTAVDLSHLDPAEVDDLSARTTPARKRQPVWATEPHPPFCAAKDGCDGVHLSAQAEVDADTGMLHVGVEMGIVGEPTVTVVAEDPFDPTEVRLSLVAAVKLAAHLIAAVQVARTQSALVLPGRAVAA